MSKRILKVKRKGFDSLIVLGAWLLWKQRNSCVFEGAWPRLNELLRTFDDELHMWCLAGAKGLSRLGLTQSAVFKFDPTIWTHTVCSFWGA